MILKSIPEENIYEFGETLEEVSVNVHKACYKNSIWMFILILINIAMSFVSVYFRWSVVIVITLIINILLTEYIKKGILQCMKIY